MPVCLCPVSAPPGQIPEPEEIPQAHYPEQRPEEKQHRQIPRPRQQNAGEARSSWPQGCAPPRGGGAEDGPQGQFDLWPCPGDQQQTAEAETEMRNLSFIVIDFII